MVLKQRIFTALILIPCVVGAVLYLPTMWFSLILAAIVVLAAWEWARLAGYTSQRARRIYSLLVALSLLLAYLSADDRPGQLIIMFGLIWWCVGLVCVLAYELEIFSFTINKPLRALMGILVLIPVWQSLVLLHAARSQGIVWVLFLLILIWLADSAAYFTGKRWGKNKLARRVSPGKSWEGVVGALVATGIFAWLFVWGFNPGTTTHIGFVIVSLITVCCSILGDLFESLMKRTANLKDSGKLLPGHGGIMDRIDSLTAASPVFYTGLVIVGGIG